MIPNLITYHLPPTSLLPLTFLHPSLKSSSVSSNCVAHILRGVRLSTRVNNLPSSKPLKKTYPPQKPWTFNSSSVSSWGLWAPPPPCFQAAWFDLVQANTAAVSSRMQQSCYDQKTLFCPGPPWPQASISFPCPLPQWSVRGGSNIDVPFVVDHFTKLILCTLTSCEFLENECPLHKETSRIRAEIWPNLAA